MPAITAADRALANLVARLLRGEPAEYDPALPAGRVRRHLLAPLAFHSGLGEFRNDFIAAALHAERRNAFLAEVVTTCRRASIPVMRLKGISYAGTIYPEPALRPMTDIDLLVPAARFGDASLALVNLGYRDEGKRNQQSAANHAVTFRRAESAIDLHRSMVQRGRMSLDIEAIWRDARDLEDGTVRPAPQHEYLIHIAHMARQEFAIPLIAFVDAARLTDAAGIGILDALSRLWRLHRAHQIVQNYIELFMFRLSSRPVLFPGNAELLAGNLPPRWLQVARKFAIHDGPRDWLTLLRASLRTRLGL
jgi:Uncharacterised nucleotidyltransferase